MRGGEGGWLIFIRVWVGGQGVGIIFFFVFVFCCPTFSVP